MFSLLHLFHRPFCSPNLWTRPAGHEAVSEDGDTTPTVCCVVHTHLDTYIRYNNGGDASRLRAHI